MNSVYLYQSFIAYLLPKLDGLKVHEENGKFKTFVKVTGGTVSYPLLALIGLVETFCRAVFLMLAKGIHFLIPAKYSEKFDTHCFYPLKDHVKFSSQATGNAMKSLWAYFQDLHITGYRVEEKKGEPSQKGDDFLETISSVDPKKLKYEIIQESLKTLGTTKSSTRHNDALRYLEKVSIHPLVFLFFLFDNKESTTYMKNFELNADSYQWDQFLTRLENNFKNTKREDLEKMIPGFCKYFSLNEVRVRRFLKPERKLGIESLFSYLSGQRNKLFDVKKQQISQRSQRPSQRLAHMA